MQLFGNGCTQGMGQMSEALHSRYVQPLQTCFTVSRDLSLEGLLQEQGLSEIPAQGQNLQAMVWRAARAHSGTFAPMQNLLTEYGTTFPANA